jgi:ElaB/YqjD/DUF883 family membrane-anchored ribosome-binding protein
MTIQSSTDQSASDFADKAAESADAAIQSARQKANDAMDSLSGTMQSVKDRTTATIERLRPQLDQVTNYAKEEPTKALLIAAGAGAGVMALVALMARSDSSGPSAKALRQAAEDRADELRKTASKRADRWRKAAQDASDGASEQADDLISSARGAAKSAYEGIADTVQQWKEQAGPVVDRIRPQLEAVSSYAKDDPAKALLIAAAAGAALMGLMNSISR